MPDQKKKKKISGKMGVESVSPTAELAFTLIIWKRMQKVYAENDDIVLSFKFWQT